MLYTILLDHCGCNWQGGRSQGAAGRSHTLVHRNPGGAPSGAYQPLCPVRFSSFCKLLTSCMIGTITAWLVGMRAASMVLLCGPLAHCVCVRHGLDASQLQMHKCVWYIKHLVFLNQPTYLSNVCCLVFVTSPCNIMALFVQVGLGEGLAPSSATNVMARLIPE